MRIILDLDNAVLIRGVLHPRYREFKGWIQTGEHLVVVWSGHEDGRAIASLMGFDFIAKDAAENPVGDVLIDDDAEQFRRFCAVTEVYTSLETFLDAKSRSPQDT